MKISIIVAMSVNRVIGKNNSLPWRLPDDLKRFKNLTMGHCLIMGRKTFESIGRPLPGREIIVVTRQDNFSPENVKVCHSLEDALELAKQIEKNGEIFIGGGTEIFEQTLDIVDRIYLTIINKHFDGDAYFPEFDESQWQHKIEEEKEYQAGDQCFKYRFEVYDKMGHN